MLISSGLHDHNQRAGGAVYYMRFVIRNDIETTITTYLLIYSMLLSLVWVSYIRFTFIKALLSVSCFFSVYRVIIVIILVIKVTATRTVNVIAIKIVTACNQHAD